MQDLNARTIKTNEQYEAEFKLNIVCLIIVASLIVANFVYMAVSLMSN